MVTNQGMKNWRRSKIGRRPSRTKPPGKVPIYIFNPPPEGWNGDAITKDLAAKMGGVLTHKKHGRQVAR